MTYVVAYDIADDHHRTRIAKILEGYGDRVQESVFECRLEADRLAELTGRLSEALTQTDGGHIRIYRVCISCLEVSKRIGPSSSPADSSVLLD